MFCELHLDNSIFLKGVGLLLLLRELFLATANKGLTLADIVKGHFKIG